MKRVSELYLDSTGITNLPTSIGNLTSHVSLSVKDCKNLMSLPSNFFNMKSLENLELSGCTKLSKILENLVTTKSVEKFDVIGTSTRLICSSIPSSLVLTSLSGLCSLTHLDISYCNLNAIPDGISGKHCSTILFDIFTSGELHDSLIVANASIKYWLH